MELIVAWKLIVGVGRYARRAQHLAPLTARSAGHAYRDEETAGTGAQADADLDGTT